VNASEMLKFIVPQGENPVPANYPVEVETTRAIIDFCENPSTRVTAESMERFAPTTPWVAWQLGMVAESEMAQQHRTLAIKLATASVHAAELCRATDFIYVNLLICGNVLLELEQYEQALDTYQTLLRLPFGGGVSARAGAHLAIGTIYRHHLVNPRMSIYHYEHAMRFVGPRADADQLLSFWTSAASLYRDAGDTIGALLCLCQAKHPMSPALIKQAIEGSLDRKLALRTRLLRQGNQTMADFVKQCPI
jgi:tetratricopeptide (TPR) repeat protein